jgi:isoleucyl-tRNA synthetase
VVSADYSEDIRIGPEILKGQADAYRRLRNTLRYLLGNLADFQESERLPAESMPELERWVLHRLVEVDKVVKEANLAFDFARLSSAIHHFCAMDLSAFYFDIRKDALYCDRADSLRRRAARTVLDQLFSCLTAWLAPILVFTTEEAWQTRFPDDQDSVHLRIFPEIPSAWQDQALGRKWGRIRHIRRAITGALEVERREKRIGSSLEAHPLVFVSQEDAHLLAGIDGAELAITSGLDIAVGGAPEGAFVDPDVPGVAVVPALAQGQKCERCWQLYAELEADGVCTRCADAVATLEAA